MLNSRVVASSPGKRMGSARRQGSVLVAGGLICALLQATLHPGHDLSLLALGLGLLVGHLAWRERLFIPGVMITLIALVNVLATYNIFPGDALLALDFVALGVGAGIATLAARRTYVGQNPLSPALIIIVIGVLIYGLGIASAPTDQFYQFFFTLWMPALVLAGLGVITLGRQRP